MRERSYGSPMGRCSVASLLAVLSACATPPAREAPPPNIVLIVADDLAWGDLGCYGQRRWRTPHLDRLAAQGVRFTDFYVAQPVCSASRAAILTGCYPNRVGIQGALTPGAKHGLAQSETTLAELARSRGYATACLGKWHLGWQTQFLPTSQGFDEFFGIPYSNDMWPSHPENPKDWPPLPTFEGERAVAFDQDQSEFTGQFTRRAIEFIERSVDAERRFFVYLAHPMPHVPLAASAAFRGRSGAGLYGDVIEELDASVGAVCDALECCGVAEDTLVMFTSDNGPWLSYGEHAGDVAGLREGKGTTFEGGVRVPLVARWPRRIPRGAVVREPAMTIDLLPTVACALNAEAPQLPIDGRDITSLLCAESGARSPHEALLFHYGSGNLEALRSGRWKLHLPHSYRTLRGAERGRNGRPTEYDYSARIELSLFDLERDPGEARNVAAEHPALVQRLLAIAERAVEELGDGARGVRGWGVRGADVAE